MGLLSAIFGSKEPPAEASEIETMRKSMLQIKAHGGAVAMLKEFTGGLQEVREPKGYLGFVVENEYLPRIAARACALMILSDIKKRLLIKGMPTEMDVGRIEAAPEYKTAYQLFTDADEILPQSVVDGLKAATIDFGATNFEFVGQPGFKDRLLKSPVRMHVAALKHQSELDWARWVRSGTRLGGS